MVVKLINRFEKKKASLTKMLKDELKLGLNHGIEKKLKNEKILISLPNNCIGL